MLSVDAGVAKGRRNAFSVVQAWRFGADRFHLIDQFRAQCDLSDLIDAVRRFRRNYKPVAILIERAANGHALISELCRKFPKLGKLIRAIDPDGRSKSARLRMHAETIVAKRIRLVADTSWHDDYVAEFIKFPHGKFTDQVDATTQFLDHAGDFVAVKQSPPTAMAVSATSSGQSRTIFHSIGGERGGIAGTRSDGRPLTGRPSTPSLPSFKVRFRR